MLIILGPFSSLYRTISIPPGTPTAEQARKAIDIIKKDNAVARVDWIPLNLSSLESVRNFAKVFIEKRLPLHILINNGEHFMKSFLVVDKSCL